MGYDKNRADHHQLLLFLMMTAADLSDQTKDWKSSRNAAVSRGLFLYRLVSLLELNFLLSSAPRVPGVFLTRRFRKSHGKPTCRNDGSGQSLYSYASNSVYRWRCAPRLRVSINILITTYGLSCEIFNFFCLIPQTSCRTVSWIKCARRHGEYQPWTMGNAGTRPRCVAHGNID